MSQRVLDVFEVDERCTITAGCVPIQARHAFRLTPKGVPLLSCPRWTRVMRVVVEDSGDVRVVNKDSKAADGALVVLRAPNPYVTENGNDCGNVTDIFGYEQFSAHGQDNGPIEFAIKAGALQAYIEPNFNPEDKNVRSFLLCFDGRTLLRP